MTDLQCYSCSISQCVNCSSLYECRECDETNQFFLNNTDYQCYPCSVANCVNCSSLLECRECNETSQFFLNSTDYQCYDCSVTNCINCSSLLECRECNQTIAYFLNVTDYQCYSCSISNCLTCSSLYECAECNETDQYFLNQTDYQCHPCSIEGCINCSSLTSCIECNISSNYGHSMINPSICAGCNESCVCDGYSLPWDHANQKCTPICGDGLIRLEEECDDGNNIAGDGCSAQCQVEYFYYCFGEPSLCLLNLNISIKEKATSKIGCNEFRAEIIIEPKLPEYAAAHLLQVVRIEHENISSYTEEYDHETGTIIIDASYSGDLSTRTITFFYATNSDVLLFNPLVPALYYSEEECQGAEQAEQLISAMVYTSYGVLLISLLSKKIVGLELFGVLQLAFFDLADYDFMNIYLAPLAKFGMLNGLNIQHHDENGQLPETISNLAISSSFINNFNIMYLLFLGVVAIGVTCFVLSLAFKAKKLKKAGIFILKEVMITFLLFNCFNIAFSAGMHWRYASPEDDLYALSSASLYLALVMVLVGIVGLQLSSSKGYGEFKSAFKPDFVSKFYVPLVIIYRIFIGIYISYNHTYELGTLLMIGLGIAFLMFDMINLPFTNVYENYRSNIIYISHLVILFTTNYYRSMKSTTPIEIKSHLHSAAIVELSAIAVCVVVSLAVGVYELVRFIQKCTKKKKLLDERHPTDISEVQFNTE